MSELCYKTHLNDIKTILKDSLTSIAYWYKNSFHILQVILPLVDVSKLFICSCPTQISGSGESGRSSQLSSSGHDTEKTPRKKSHFRIVSI